MKWSEGEAVAGFPGHSAGTWLMFPRPSEFPQCSVFVGLSHCTWTQQAAATSALLIAA